MKNSSGGVWVDAREHLVTKRDERVALMVYRVVKLYISQIACFIFGFLLCWGLFK